MRRSGPALAAGAVLALGLAWARADEAAPVPAPAKPADAAPAVAAKGRDVGHMHNVSEVTPRFVRGSAPVTADDFVLLAKMGVKVVVSVDGAKPDVEAAHKAGLRYVHVPFGYGGVPRAQQVLLYKAFTTLEGPFYVHCHHGKHRGPAGCAIGLMGVEGWTAEQAVAELKAAGTAAKYDGLYALATSFTKPTAAELAAAPKEIPEVVPVAAFTQAMVDLDDTFDRLKAVKKAQWCVPADHPDVDPKHEAVILAEAFRELARRDEVTQRPADFVKHVGDSETAAWILAKALEGKVPDATQADEAFTKIEKACAACHGVYRDAVHPPAPTAPAAR